MGFSTVHFEANVDASDDFKLAPMIYRDSVWTISYQPSEREVSYGFVIDGKYRIPDPTNTRTRDVGGSHYSFVDVSSLIRDFWGDASRYGN